MTMRVMLAQWIAVALLLGAVAPGASAESVVSGTASYRERIALPPDAVFEAILEDVSLADAPAVEIGRTRIDGAGQPPIAFSIAYDPAAIDPRHTYGVRTRIVAGDRLLFVSDTANRVLTRDAPSETAIMMRMVSTPAGTGGDEQGVIGAPGLRLPLLLNGMFVYMADAARFSECQTGRDYRVAMEGDYRRLEKAYLDARGSPGQPLMVTFEGSIEERPRIEDEGTEATAIVVRFINVWPGETCERNRTQASLTNTYWRIVRLGDEELRAVDGRREPHMLLRADKPGFNATVGCNQMVGGYETTGETLRFGQAASTMMACPPPLDRLERSLAEALTNTRTWQIVGQVLELRDEAGSPVALLQAVYLR